MLVDSAFFRINQQQRFFHCDLPVFPLFLTGTLAKYPLFQVSFSYSFFFGAEIHKIEIFKNLPFAKISTCEITIFLACKNEYMQKLVCLRYVSI